MKVKCNRAALYEAIQLASSIVPARTPKPVLQCAKLWAGQPEGKLTVIATDGELTIRYVVGQVQVEKSGAAVVAADRLAAILHETTDETVDLAVKDTTCEVRGKDSIFRIYGQDPEDFPVIDQAKAEAAFSVKAEQLKRMIHLTAFAAARENTRYAINGVLWEQTGKKLRMVATDGRRLALADGEVSPGKKDAQNTAIVPLKALALLERLLHDGEEKLEIGFSGSQLVATTPLAEVSSTLAQGRFPKYTEVIPTGADKKAQVDAEAFRSAVRRAALLTNDQSRGILLAFEGETVCLSSSTPEAGDAEITMKASYEGAPLKIGFNPQYLLDMLRVISEAEVVCEFSDGSKPGLLRAGKDFSYVLMPVTV